MTTAEMTRRELLRKGVAGTALGAAALAVPGIALARGPAGGVTGSESQVGEIYQLQAAFHRAKSTADLDLMMSLWADDSTLANQGDPNSPYSGSASIRAFFQNSGSFTHRRFSLVPSFKTRSTSVTTATTPGSTLSATTSGITTRLRGRSRPTCSSPASPVGSMANGSSRT